MALPNGPTNNGLLAWLIRLATALLMLWSGWATAEIIDLKAHKAYTIGHSEQFEKNVMEKLQNIENKVDALRR